MITPRRIPIVIPDADRAVNALRDSVEGIRQVLREIVNPPKNPWIAPTFQNSWVNYGTPHNVAGYYRDPLVVVHLRGVVKSGTVASGTPIFTLPVGYRPAARELRVVISNGAIGRCDVYDDGRVCAESGNNAWFSLDGISFRAAAT